jgi:seryl-tRNA synthetase
MLDIKLIRENKELVKNAISKKNINPLIIDEILEIDEKRRSKIKEVETLKAENNKVSAEIAKLKKEGKDTTDIIQKMRDVSDKIKKLDDELLAIEEEFNKKMLMVPNMPDESVPVGKDEKSNVVVRVVGEKPSFTFKPKPHWEIAEYLDILDDKRASKITGARFTLYKGLGALLERALINFMLDVQTKEHGYTEIMPPLLVNRDTMTGTGQLPKLEDDMFKTVDPDYFLIPTSEVPLVNIHKDEILKEKDLPLKYTAYTPCFRKEAGSYGKDMKGIVRMHQFNKVELVKFTHPDTSYDELEKLLNDAEEILKRLKLHYRVVLLCSGDMSFASAKTYDIEVWHSGVERYWETSSCSNCTDFQARRSRIKLRAKDNKTYYVHTLNGSGLATSRLLPAIIENYQTENMEVLIPDVLKPYMGGIDKITKK